MLAKNTALVKNAPAERLPDFVEPQLATRVDAAPEGERWLHEIKLDGYRLLARKDGATVRLLSRNKNEWTSRAQKVADAVAALPAKSALLDGEMVILDDEGASSFQRLQNVHRRGSGEEPAYVVFDLLHLNGKNLRGLPLMERKAILKTLLPKKSGVLKFSAHFEGDGDAAFAASCEHGLEGIISKLASGRYVPGRGKNWLKVKCDNRQEFVIAGFTPSTNDPRAIGALLLALAEKGGSFRYSGKVGTGFTHQLRRELYKKLGTLKADDPRIRNKPRMKDATWIKPVLVAQIAFRELTNEGLVRQGVFQGFRDDKAPSETKKEKVKKVAEVTTRRRR